MFKLADTDDDGALSKGELKKLIQDYPEMEVWTIDSFGDHVCAQVLFAKRGGRCQYYMFNQIDTDDDAKITLQEFLTKLHANQAVRPFAYRVW